MLAQALLAIQTAGTLSGEDYNTLKVMKDAASDDTLFASIRGAGIGIAAGLVLGAGYGISTKSTSSKRQR